MATIELLRSQIEKRIGLLQKSLEENKVRKEQMAASLFSDEEYISLKEKALEASKRLAAHRAALLNEPDMRKIVADMKDNNQEIKELRSVLSGELFGYVKDSDKFEFEDSQGNLRRIQISAKIVKTNQPSLF